MNLSKGTTQLMIAFALLALAVGSLSLTHLALSGDVLSEEETTSSSATITKQVAISKSANLTTGILFGSLDPNSNANNATGNFNSSSQTQFWLTIDSTTNTPLDICTKDSAALTNGGQTIPNAGYKWNSTTTNDAVNPYIFGTMFAMTTNYNTANKIADSQTSGTYYLRFTLDVPAGQAAGAYSNTVYFKAADDSTGC
jgi:hypothetical protein